MDVSLIIPFYNEKSIIDTTLCTAHSYLQKHFTSFELIMADDGSDDGGSDLLEKRRELDFILMKSPVNMGKGYVVKNAVLLSTGKYVFYTDADLPYDLSNIQRCIGLFYHCEADVVAGLRSKERSGYTGGRRFLSNAFSSLATGFLPLPVTDTQCGFKAFHAEAAKRLFSMCSIHDFGFDMEMIYLAGMLGLKVLPLSLEMKNEIRPSRVSPFSDSVKMAFDVLKVKVNSATGKYKTHEE